MEKVEQEVSLEGFKISKNALESIVGLATVEIEGVAGLSGTIIENIKDRLSKRQLTKGVNVSVEDGVFLVLLHVVLDYGYVIGDVAKKIQANVKGTLEAMMDIEVKSVDIFVDNINFSK